MGIGDQLIATGLARGAIARRKRVAFGDGRKIIWDKNSPMIFQHNPNIAPPGSEAAFDLEWVNFYKGSRLYNKQVGNRWIWNFDFRPVPGEMFFLNHELKQAEVYGSGFVVIEPDVPAYKAAAPNKTWPAARYDALALELIAKGYHVRQLVHGHTRHRVKGGQAIKTPTFRVALSVLKRAALYIGPEGGMHHGAAAVGIPGVVLFGGFAAPTVTGYDMHTNLTGGAEPCGSLYRCQHCIDAMAKISCDEVLDAAMGYLGKAAA